MSTPMSMKDLSDRLGRLEKTVLEARRVFREIRDRLERMERWEREDRKALLARLDHLEAKDPRGHRSPAPSSGTPTTAFTPKT
jgi:hypothetical protein